MQELNLRLGQAVALTYAQTDDNFKRLKTAIDALEVSVAGAGLGTVTSVGLTLPNIFTVTNSPVTTTGSLTATLASQSANRIFASPNGASGQPTFRGLVAADLGTMIVPITNGGTGSNVPATINQVISSNGSVYEGRTITPSGGLTVAFATNSITLGLNPALINITDFAGVLTSAKGGTGLSGPFAINQILIGNGSSSWTSAVLTAGPGITISNAPGVVTIENTATGVSQLNSLTGPVYIGFGSSGNDVNVTTPTTSDITLNIPSAGPSPIVRGLLTAADWTTFNNKVGGSGTTNYIPKFTASGTVGNSVLYEGLLGYVGLGTISPTANFHISGTGLKSLLVESTNSNANIKVSNTSGFPTSATLTSGGILTTLATNLTVNTGLVVYPIGNVQITKGFAIADLQYFNIPGNTAFSSNEQYGIILGSGSDATMSVTLPLTPMNGQEVCILLEEDKTLTIASGIVGRLIYGKSSTPAATLSLTINLNTHGSALIFKYAAAGNGGLQGAWYLTGF
jgi:hypothetical protein